MNLDQYGRPYKKPPKDAKSTWVPERRGLVFRELRAACIAEPFEPLGNRFRLAVGTRERVRPWAFFSWYASREGKALWTAGPTPLGLARRWEWTLFDLCAHQVEKADRLDDIQEGVRAGGLKEVVTLLRRESEEVQRAFVTVMLRETPDDYDRWMVSGEVEMRARPGTGLVGGKEGIVFRASRLARLTAWVHGLSPDPWDAEDDI